MFTFHQRRYLLGVSKILLLLLPPHTDIYVHYSFISVETILNNNPNNTNNRNNDTTTSTTTTTTTINITTRTTTRTTRTATRTTTRAAEEEGEEEGEGEEIQLNAAILAVL